MTSPDDDRDRMDLLAEEFADRLRRGESPSISEFAARDSGSGDEVRALLASVAMIEQWKRQKLHARPDPDTAAPDHLGDFRIVRELGRGGMGIVYEAEQTSLGRRVAVKVLPRHSLLDPTRRLRFQHEAQTAAALHHTNIVPIFGVGEFEGLHYLVMQLIDGRGLDVVLDGWRRGAVPDDETDAGDPPVKPGGPAPRFNDLHWRRVARVGVQAAEALHYAHGLGVLHRDVKPANLLLDRHEVTWVTDFGLAKMVERESLSRSGDVIGTLQYMAPERFETEADARSDVYSLGLTLYELLTLVPAFEEASPSMLIRRVSEGHPPRPSSRNPSIPRDLETIVLKAISREPGHRYATAGAMADDLKRYLDDRPVLARRASPAERLARWCRRNKSVAALSATALALLLLATTVGWAGYASTTRALTRESLRRDEAERARRLADQATRRADENVALSLAAFEDLFNRIAPRDSGPPDRLDHRGGPPPPPPHDGMGPDDDGPPPPPPRPPGDHGPPGDPPPGGPQGAPQDMTELLQGVLTFYDRFAVRNATNDHLHREAARAYRRVGDLQHRLGRDAEAESAYARSAQLFETILAGDPTSAELRYELASVYSTAEPTSDDPAALGRSERSLRRALALGEGLAGSSPDDPDLVSLLVRIHGRIGATLDREGRHADAERSYRTALSLESTRGARGPSRFPHLISLADTRRSLAESLGTGARRAEALSLLRQCRRDLAAASTLAPPGRDGGRSLGHRYQSLAEALEAIGEPALADDVLRDFHETGPPGPRSPGPGPGPGRRRPPPPPPEDGP